MACCELLNCLSFSRFLLFRGCLGQVLFSPVFKYRFQKRCTGVHRLALGESFPTSIYLQKIGFDTAENDPYKVCPLSAYRCPRLNNVDNSFRNANIRLTGSRLAVLAELSLRTRSHYITNIRSSRWPWTNAIDPMSTRFDSSPGNLTAVISEQYFGTREKS